MPNKKLTTSVFKFLDELQNEIETDEIKTFDSNDSNKNI